MQALAGRRILVTRRLDQAGPLAARLEALGASVDVIPAIELVQPEDPAELRAALGRLGGYDWLLLTSPNAVGFVRRQLASLGCPSLPQAGLRIGCVGPATRDELERQFPGVQVHALPAKDYRAEGLAQALAEQPAGVAGQRLLIPTSDRARDVLGVALRELGAEVTLVVAYRTRSAAGLAQRLGDYRGRPDLVCFASPSAVSAVAEAAPDWARGLPVAVIGPVSAATARRMGMDVQVVAEPSTVPGLVRCIAQRLGAFGA